MASDRWEGAGEKWPDGGTEGNVGFTRVLPCCTIAMAHDIQYIHQTHVRPSATFYVQFIVCAACVCTPSNLARQPLWLEQTNENAHKTFQIRNNNNNNNSNGGETIKYRQTSIMAFCIALRTQSILLDFGRRRFYPVFVCIRFSPFHFIRSHSSRSYARNVRSIRNLKCASAACRSRCRNGLHCSVGCTAFNRMLGKSWLAGVWLKRIGHHTQRTKSDDLQTQ